MENVNHGAGYGLEIPVNFKFLGPAKAIQWAENAVKKVIQNIDQKVKHCKKYFFKENVFLRENCFCTCVRFIEIIFRQKVHLGHEKSVRLTTVGFIIVRFVEIFSYEFDCKSIRS